MQIRNKISWLFLLTAVILLLLMQIRFFGLLSGLPALSLWAKDHPLQEMGNMAEDILDFLRYAGDHDESLLTGTAPTLQKRKMLTHGAH